MERKDTLQMEGESVIAQEPEIPCPEVTEKPVRRRFTAEYKRKILAEADPCSKPGAVGELLRREGLYSSYLTNWRRQRDEGGALAGLTPKRRGRKARRKNPLTDEVTRLERGQAAVLHVDLQYAYHRAVRVRLASRSRGDQQSQRTSGPLGGDGPKGSSH